MPNVKVGSHAFSTQRQAQGYVRRVLRVIGVRDPVTDKGHIQLLENLLAQSPNRDAVVGGGYTTFAVEPNARKTGLQVYVNRTDGSRGYLSVINNCITGRTMSSNSKLKLMLRWAIQPQVHAFRDLHKEIRDCAMCRATDRPLVVDHVVPFRAIVESFLKEALTPPDTFVRNPDTNHWEFRAEDDAFKRAWATYHQERARFQMVCEVCNRSKGCKQD